MTIRLHSDRFSTLASASAGANRYRKSLPTADGDPVYVHPNGWLIVRQTRSWSERVGAMRGQGLAGPKTFWVVVRSHYKNWNEEVYLGQSFNLLREAAAWCDEHPEGRDA